MTAKSESIADGKVDFPLLRLVEGEVEGRNLRVIVEMVDCRGDDTILNGKDGGNGLDCAGSTKEVASH